MKELQKRVYYVIAVFSIISLMYFSNQHLFTRREKLLLPLYVQEQLGKHHQHLEQIAWLTKQVDRTLILPPVGNARIGVKFSLPFSSYWDSSYMKKEIPIIDFFDWKIDKKISASLVVIQNSNSDDSVTKTQQHCLSTLPLLPFVNLDKHQHIFLSKTTEQERIEILSQQQNELLLLCWLTPDRLVKQTLPNRTISFSESATALGRELAQELGRYIAIHWRFEVYIKGIDHIGCAESLVYLVNRTMEERGISSIFFATDLPLYGDLVSQTFARPPQATWLAYRIVIENLKPRMYKPQPGMDSGLHAITDAVLLSRAEIVIAQGADCGKSSSSFLRLAKEGADIQVLNF